jgi:hypothetical protein
MEVSDASNDQLWRVCRKLPSDFEPYGWAARLPRLGRLRQSRESPRRAPHV